MKLTPAQRWTLQAVADGKGTSPGFLGIRMMERPGAADHRNGTPYKMQGNGRMGGAMMARLEKMGLVRLAHSTNGQWHPAKAHITSAGRAALEQEDAG